MLCSHNFIFITIQNSGHYIHSRAEETAVHVGIQKNYILLQVHV